MDYLALKHAHAGLGYLTALSFFIRGLLMLAGSPWRSSRLARIAPHVIDTFLLVFGVMLAWQAQFNPLEQPWLMAKIVLLVVYVLLGVWALRRGPTRSQRSIAFVLGLFVVMWIIAIAKTKMVLLFF